MAATLTGIALAATAADAALTLGINLLLSAQKYNILIVNARKEGRDVSIEELAKVKEESDAATKSAVAALEEAAEEE